ncbi:membrane-associated phospholipid phosphatase [Duganella sp. 3397]|uniref:YjbH domain-containing protein n=1 Tax=Duganella sp. 3397 TaxID=2817732 RepID=UPI0028611A8F|nr:YjbH domain-containing protein [Duganella sp. 3397]MDR7052271.1 membrane-associated phospholipid phosphatase [Duganella sp. 3397]
MDLLSALRKSVKYTWCGCLILVGQNSLAATPGVSGQSGYINTPSAVVEADGTFSVGYGYDSPYGQLWVTSTVLPFLQVTGRYVSITGVPAFGEGEYEYGKGYGRYKDKVIDGKARLWQEGSWVPSVAVGVNDVFGTELFRSQYAVATKTLGAAKNVEVSVGYGDKRIDGLFAGARWTPASHPRWSLVAEYNSVDYKQDYKPEQTGAARRRKGPAVGLEYRWGWLGLQASRGRDNFTVNAFVSIPFGEREYIPKIYEPPVFEDKDPITPPAIPEWRDDPGYRADLIRALAAQDFKNTRVELNGNTLHITLTNNRISNMGRAVGRAMRTVLAFLPEGVTAVNVTYTKLDQPLTTYEFFDLPRLKDYFAGKIDRQTFAEGVLVRYPNRDDVISDEQQAWLTDLKDDNIGKPNGAVPAVASSAVPVAVTGAPAVLPSAVSVAAVAIPESSGDPAAAFGAAAPKTDGTLRFEVGHEGDAVQVTSEDRESNRFKLAPKLGFFFNDPSGAFRYSLSAAATYDRRISSGLYLNTAASMSVIETVSAVTQPSNSNLPHVRTDIAKYMGENRFALSRVLLNKYANPAERLYVRGSVGLYEDMYRGVGGQVLYLPKNSRWAVDLSVDALQQRGYKRLLDSLDYKTVTAIASLHYKLPYGMTVTARAGRFLAKDEGVRVEFKRRFQSGIEIGAWYTHTNGNDITTPGTPAKPYQDRGVFLSIPFNRLLPMDSQGTAGFSLSPWTRDVGQMVASPGDLYDMVEQPRRDMNSYDGLGNFAERPDEQQLPAVTQPDDSFPNPIPVVRERLDQSLRVLPAPQQWVRPATLAVGAILVSALADKPVDRQMKKYQDERVMRGLNTFGNALPYALVGAAGTAFALGDERMQNTGFIAMQSIAAASGFSLVGKYAVGRARPLEERGTWSRTGDDNSRSDASFPSGHAAVSFAAVTPFAKEYDAPWLYGVAALGAAGRVAGRKHWVSDTVAGSVIGYAVGSWLWQAQRNQSDSNLAIIPGLKSVSVTWQKSY